MFHNGKDYFNANSRRSIQKIKELGLVSSIGVSLYDTEDIEKCIDIGGLDVFSKHFNEMCRSKYLFLSPSSFSIFTGYLSLGTIIGDEKLYKFRPNIFNNLKITPNFNIHDNINEFEEFIKKQNV